jgi:hypothetical protein
MKQTERPSKPHKPLEARLTQNDSILTTNTGSKKPLGKPGTINTKSIEQESGFISRDS